MGLVWADWRHNAHILPKHRNYGSFFFIQVRLGYYSYLILLLLFIVMQGSFQFFLPSFRIIYNRAKLCTLYKRLASRFVVEHLDLWLYGERATNTGLTWLHGRYLLYSDPIACIYSLISSLDLNCVYGVIVCVTIVVALTSLEGWPTCSPFQMAPVKYDYDNLSTHVRHMKQPGSVLLAVARVTHLTTNLCVQLRLNLSRNVPQFGREILHKMVSTGSKGEQLLCRLRGSNDKRLQQKLVWYCYFCLTRRSI